jgi:membrane-bound lytic murein transglycosylase D
MANDLTDSLIIKRLADISSFIDLSFNSKVKDMIKFYTKKRHDKIETMLGLTNFYFPMIEETLDKYNLPLELKYMAVIESAMNARAVSRVGASGLWQFMYKTGKLYDLEVNSYIDERYESIKATDAAARYLKTFIQRYGIGILLLAAL